MFFEAGNYNRSFNNYSKAADALFEVNLSESYRAALGIAKTQYHRSLYRFAIKSLSEVIEFAIKNNDYELRAACGEYLGLIYSIWQSSSESKTYFTDAFSTFEKMKNEKGCLRISEKLFELNYADHVFDSALYYSNISLKIAESLKQEESFQLSKLNRISALIRLERFTEAKKELDEFASIKIKTR